MVLHRLAFTGLCRDTTACGDELLVAKAQLALLGRGDHDHALAALSDHHFAHYQHGDRPELTGLWLSAQLAKASTSRSVPSHGLGVATWLWCQQS